VVDGPDVAVLQYKYIPGNHKASSGIQFLRILEQVSFLHKDKFVHGDIRESNIVFAGNDVATLIDFDLSRKAGQPYVSNFNVDINDGKRHESAQPFQPMNYVHDYFALAEVMKLYESKDDTTNWQALIRKTAEMKDVNDDDKWNISLSRIEGIGGNEPRDTGSPKRIIDTLNTIEELVSNISLADA
jgi:serine/threonine protein kinase